MQRRVVITGIGIYSCIGRNTDEVADALYRGRSGIGVDPARLAYGYRSSLTGMPARPDLRQILDRRQRASLPEQGEYAVVATREAMQHAGIDLDYTAAHDMGVIYGNDSSTQAVIESHEIMREKKDALLIGSGGVFRSMTSTVSMNLATIFGLRGVNLTVGAACASSAHALGLACLFIRNGLQDLVLCGGAQEVNVYSMAGFDGLSAFSRRMDEPSKASRPFDVGRDGLVPSGGAASLILEEAGHARQRGATVYGEVFGYGFSSNGGSISQPSEAGALTAMQCAMTDAGMKADDIGYVNAHATATPQGDRCEAAALDVFFGDRGTPVSSTKSMTGHECWMAGASEAVYSLLMMKHGFLAPNLNLETPDEAARRLNILRRTSEQGMDVFLSNSFGFGGTNTTLIIGKYRN
ncbi:MAG: beta-ketoacyl-[acyl-carrier-protein] synthase family protein [Tannerella sp.]|jgi:3-oxoacyl-[acyl-carrier-protein] synthase-1|nr:beta-ketoacyl-[acyl-carrier-protein] synthase family protein [Tannerella sp.]